MIASLLVIDYIYLSRAPHAIGAVHVFNLAMALLYLYLFISGGLRNTGLLWFFVYPPLVFYVMGVQGAVVSLSILAAASGAYVWIVGAPAFLSHYPTEFLLRFSGSLFAVILLSYFYERSREEQSAALRGLVKEVSAHRNELETRVTERTQELVIAKNKAEAASLAKSAFLANMSHEMRTPIHQVSGMAQLIKREPLTPKQADWMDKLDVACRRLTGIINAILELTRIESGQIMLAEEPVNIKELLSEVSSVLHEQAAAKRLQLITDAETVPFGLLGDKEHIKQALHNLVSNAVRFTETGSVTIRSKIVEEDDQSALIHFEVQDTGIGIAPEDQCRLFSIFEQVDNSSTRKYSGLGAGLAMTKKIAQIMGGDAGCDSRLGEGSTFWFAARLKKASLGDHLESKGSGPK